MIDVVTNIGRVSEGWRGLKVNSQSSQKFDLYGFDDTQWSIVLGESRLETQLGFVPELSEFISP